MLAGENHGVHDDPVSVTFLVKELANGTTILEELEENNGVLTVKKIQIDMNIVDFMALFKRFEITISLDGLLEGKSYETSN